MLMDRNRAAQLGRETVTILEAGSYRAPSGRIVDIAPSLRRAVDETRSYPSDIDLPSLPPRDRPARTTARATAPATVENASTLAAAYRLAKDGLRALALNFASAKNPGGGFLGGARAQEESLARSSGLYACLRGNAMYAYHAARRDTMYSDYAIYSPDLPVFRDDEGNLLEQPYPCSFITSPAVNAKAVLERDPSRRPQIREAMQSRVRKVLSIAAAHGHEALVLGAWGCGVFGNDCGEIAELFHDALGGEFRGLFDPVVFAILDWSEDRRFIGPFQSTF